MHQTHFLKNLKFTIGRSRILGMRIEVDLGKIFENFAVPRIDSMIDLRIAPEVAEEYFELMANGGRPIIYGNHQSHADGWALALVVRYLRALQPQNEKVFPGIVLPLARSIFTGHQGRIIRAITNLSVPILEQNGVKPIPYTRNKDITKYGLNKNSMELRPMIRLVREGYGIGNLPEASVQGGRHKNFFGFLFGGEINGIIDLDDKSIFLDFYKLIDKYGQVNGTIFYMPVAMEGGYRFIGADIPLPTLEFLEGLVLKPKNPFQVTIERPVTPERLINELREDWQKDPIELSDFLMKQVAIGLPRRSRGIYQNLPDLEIIA